MKRATVLRLASSAVCATLASAAGENEARAYSYESAVSTGCHERISTAAVREVRAALPAAAGVAPRAEDVALIGDLPFEVDADVRDIAAVAFLIGVRDNDLKGRGPSELDQLAAVHGDPAHQREHCLRGPADDDPEGSARALASCRDFIREKVVEALEGISGSGALDPERRTPLEVTLSLRGHVDVMLPLYWARIGQAAHALQDSFTHAFRTPDRLRVRAVLNWIDDVNGAHDEARDGPVHRSGLDRCEDLDDLMRLNMEVAQRATGELLHATLDPALSREAKLAAVDATLARYLTFEPGCTEGNAWCDSPERHASVAASCGLSAQGGGPSAALLASGVLLSALLVLRRRRRCGVSFLLAFVGAPAIAHAEDSPGVAVPPAAAEPEPTPGVPTPAEAKSEQREQRHRSQFSLYAAGSGSVTNPSLSGQLGARVRLSERVSLGLDGELNGWYGVQTARLRTGALNVYATAIFHFPLRFERVNLRTTLNAGTSTMLIDLYGAPRGATGIFLGVVPLGLEWKVSERFYVIFDALGVALPVPQLSGAPFAYPQYRTALGIELAL